MINSLECSIKFCMVFSSILMFLILFSNSAIRSFCCVLLSSSCFSLFINVSDGIPAIAMVSIILDNPFSVLSKAALSCFNSAAVVLMLFYGILSSVLLFVCFAFGANNTFVRTLTQSLLHTPYEFLFITTTPMTFSISTAIRSVREFMASTLAKVPKHRLSTFPTEYHA